MRVFVTGASGFIGSAIVQELLTAGHQVLGLARSDAKAQAVHLAGAEVHRGSLEDLPSLKAAAAACDAVIHTAFIHDGFANFAHNCAVDRAASAAMLEVLAGSHKPFVSSSGVLLLQAGKEATEDAPATTEGLAGARGRNESMVLEASQRGIRTAVVRLAPSVHGEGDRGFVPALISAAREHGTSAYIGEGRNRWPAVHRLDAALLYRLAIEKAAPGSVLHAIADSGVPTRDIATVIGRRLHLPVVSKSGADAARHFTWIEHFFAIDCVASSQKTQAELGWTPTHPGLLADLDQPYYFVA